MLYSRLQCYRRLLYGGMAATIILAVALRFIGLGFGRGVLTPRPDEELLRSGVLISLTGDLNPHYAVWGHLYHYLYLAVAAVGMAVEVWTGRADSWYEAIASAHLEPWPIIWWGRAISAAAGVLTLPATYLLARHSLRSRLEAICACLLLATLFLHVRDSHFATCDILLTLLCTTALAALVRPGRLRPVPLGVWTGLALAVKLQAVTVVLTFVTTVLLRRSDRSEPQTATPPDPPFVRGGTWAARLRMIVIYLAVAVAVMLILQPYLFLDPMETWHGLFSDLFNPERRPFRHGIDLRNASIVMRYYMPQGVGWLVGGAAVAGWLLLARHLRRRASAVVVIYAFWSLVAVVCVQRIFLRYLDPVLPVACVLAAHSIGQMTRWVLHGRASTRFALTLGVTGLIAIPNLARCLWLDHRLLQTDTRALAGRWIEQNVAPGSRILWSGYGNIRAHLTMPWLHTGVVCDRRHIRLRLERGLPTEVEKAVTEWKRKRAGQSYEVVGLAFGPDRPERSALEAYPMEERGDDLTLLGTLQSWSRALGLLSRESPRWDLMRRHISSVLVSSPEALANRGERYVVVTGMPCDSEIAERLGQRYDEVKVFEPGVPWEEYGGRVMYDLGDAWYLPNLGIGRVERPGPQIRIFQLKARP